MEYFVMPTPILNKWLSDDFDTWLATPGRDGRPHASDNAKRNLTYARYADELAGYKGNWALLWE